MVVYLYTLNNRLGPLFSCSKTHGKKKNKPSKTAPRHHAGQDRVAVGVASDRKETGFQMPKIEES